MKSRCSLHYCVVSADTVEELLDKQDEHIFRYHTDELREDLDEIGSIWFEDWFVDEEEKDERS